MLNFFRRHIGAKISLGYLAAIILMAVFGLFAINTQDQISATVNNLTQNLEAKKTIAENINTRMALVRLYAEQYVKEPVQINSDNFNAEFIALEDVLNRPNMLSTDPGRREVMNQIRTDVHDYGSAFGEIVRLTQENQGTEAKILSVKALSLDNRMNALRVHINTINNPTFFLLYGNAQTEYQSMRLNILQYIAQGDEHYAVLVTNNYKNMKLALGELETLLQDQLQVKNASDAIYDLELYHSGFSAIQQNQIKMRNMFTEKLDVLEPRISKAVSGVADSIKQEFEQYNLASQQQVQQLRIIMIVTMLVLIVFSLVTGVFFSYNLARPLQQVMLASQQIANKDLTMLASQMSTLSQGDVHLQLDITAQPIGVTQQDEVGQMAKAFNEIIFRLQDTKIAFEQMAMYLDEMTGAAGDVAQGNLNTSITVHSERDVLAKALINMVGNLRTAQQQLLNQLARLATLHAVDSMITTNQDITMTLTFLLDQAIHHLSVDAGEIFILDQSNMQLKEGARSGFSADYSLRKYQPIIEAHALKMIEAVKNGIIIQIDEWQITEDMPYQYGYSVPLMVQGDIIGVLMTLCFNPLPENGNWKSFLETLAGQAALAYNNYELVRVLEERVAQRTMELQRSQRYFQSLVRHSPVAIVVTDTQGKISQWNPAAETLFGYLSSETLGQHLDDLIAPREYHEEALALSKESDKHFIHLFTHRNRKDGSVIDVEIFGEPVYVEGEQVGTLAMYHDITEIQQARKTAEEATRIKSEFLANMSHEIRTPMNGVMGMTSLLLDTPLTETQRDFVDTIRVSAESLLIIVNDILDFSKIEAGRMELEEQPFNLRDCVEGALDLVAHQAASKQLELAYLMSPLVPENVYGDETRLRQILVNLMSNSVKFTEKGEVVVSIQPEESEDQGEQNTGICTLHFTIRDTGIGIPPDRIDRLFQSFTQVDASTTRKYGGTGLGLTICKKLTEMMNGQIWVESEGIPGKGSTFHFTLQLKAAAEQTEVYHASLMNTLHGKSVLIVDDNLTNREILLHMTRGWEMNAVAFSNGNDALAEFDRGFMADMAILDIQMPDMDGVMLALEIRKRYSPEQLPLVFLTSLGRKEEIPEAVKPSAYLHKPIKSSLLFNTLVTIFSERPVHIDPLPGNAVFDGQMAERHPLRILLAEDHVVNQKVALLTLERLGYRADVVSNGLEVLQAFQRQFYDVILMDAQMPEMDGVDATFNLRNNLPIDKQPYIIALTANVLMGDRERYLKAGMDDYLSKPMHIEHLVKALEKCQAGGRFKNDNTAPITVDENLPPGGGQTLMTETFPDVLDRMDIPAPVDFKLLNEYFPGFETDINIIKDVVRLYLDDSPLRLEKIRQSISLEDANMTRNMAHALKGASLTFGAVHLAELAKDLEMIARNGNLDGADHLLQRIEVEYKRVKFSLNDLIEG